MVLAAGLLAPVAACQRQQRAEPPPLETVDVAPRLDAELSTEDDLVAVRRAPEIAGIVPEGVPPELPLFRPSSVIDFGDLPGGRAYVTFDTVRGPPEVRRWLGERLPAAGWSVAADAGGLSATSGTRRVRYGLTDLAPGTRIRLEYPPQPLAP